MDPTHLNTKNRTVEPDEAVLGKEEREAAESEKTGPVQDVWKTIENYPNYEVSPLGVVRRGGRVLKPHACPQGYLRVKLYAQAQSKGYLVHQLVALAFIPRQAGRPYVNHIDGCRTNNSAQNLEWVSNQENSLRRKHVPATRKGRAVTQLDDMHRVVRVWPGAAQAGRAVGISGPYISVCCRRGWRAAGFHWEYTEQVLEEWQAGDDEEIWRPWTCAGKACQVSSLGRIKTERGALVHGSRDTGYTRYHGVAIHRAVANAFPDLCPKPENASMVNHKDGNKQNNRASNLEWVTASQNVQHAHDLGLNTNRRIVRRTTDGRLYSTLVEAAKDNNTGASAIIKACKGGRMAGGHRWEYVSTLEYLVETCGAYKNETPAQRSITNTVTDYAAYAAAIETLTASDPKASTSCSVAEKADTATDEETSASDFAKVDLTDYLEQLFTSFTVDN